MSDPRNVAHDKKVKQEKEHHAAPGHKEKEASAAASNAESPAAHAEGADLEKSVAVLSKLKEMEFHSRANLETLAALMLTIDDELKQKDFSDPVGALYSTQEDFHTKIAAVIERYEAHVGTLKPSV